MIDQQLAMMAQQLALLGGAPLAAPAPAAAPIAIAAPIAVAKNEDEPPAGPVNYDVKTAFGANLPRLAAIKKKFDPANFFRVNHNVAPAALATA